MELQAETGNLRTATVFVQQGIEFKRRGEMERAAECYESALRLEPQLAEARYNLGILWRDMGRVDRAVACLREAWDLRPDVPLICLELANLLAAGNQREEALRHYRIAAALAPEWPPATFNLGNALLELGCWEEAEASFRNVLRMTPADADAWTNLGRSLQEQGRDMEAEEAFRRAVVQDPRHAAAWICLGNALKRRGDFPQAASCYQRAQDADPGLAAATINLGNTWIELGRLEEALAAYTRAAELRPTDPRSFVDLGGVLRRLGRNSQAIEAYQRAIQLDGDCHDAWLNLGHLLRGIGDAAQAGAMYRELARRKPQDPFERLRVAANCPQVFGSQEELNEFRDEFLSVARELAGAAKALDLARLNYTVPECPYNLQFLDGNLCPLKRAFGQVYAAYFESRNRHSPPSGAGTQRWRVGFVVTAGHEAAFLKLLAGVVARLDDRQFEALVLCSRLEADRIRKGMPCDHVAVVGFPERFDRIAEQIRQTACDLLYYWEIGTDPTNYFLPFLRLAPVQVTCWGIQVTSGIPAVDAYLSSSWVEGPGADEHYTEALCRGATLMTYQIPVRLPARRPARSDFGLPDGAHVYGCVQNLGKFHPGFDELLAGILRQDARGVLVLGRDHHGVVVETLRRRWMRVMPDVLPRIRFVPPQLSTDYLGLLSLCDVLLDPAHFGGVTTTYDAVALAKPVVTLPTEYHRGRYTAGCLHKIGVTDTIARDRADYVRLAVELAEDRDRRELLERRLVEAGPLAFEDLEAVREHERIFQELLSRIR